MSLFEIKEYTEANFDDVYRIVHKTIEKIYPKYYPPSAVDFFHSHHSKENMLEKLPKEITLLLFIDNKTAGTAALFHNEISRFFVLPEYQGRGYGRILLKELEKKVDSSKYDEIILDSSLGAVSFYQKNKYTFRNYKTIDLPGGGYLCYLEMAKNINTQNSKINYDNKIFSSVENTKNGEVNGDTVFYYHQKKEMVWAEYYGGVIKKGFLLGTVNDVGELEFNYEHINTKNETRTGKCRSFPEILENGRIALCEKWEWTNGDKSKGESKMIEKLPDHTLLGITKADAILIGAGSGLSTAAGLRYDDTDFFNATFPGYHARYGLRTINEADFFQFPTPEEQYAYWTRLIATVRYNHPPGKPYLDLRRIIGDKPYFILTTNTDGQFQKAGFESDKICTPQGDLAFFQCSRLCNDTIYPNGQTIQHIMAALDPQDFSIRSEDIPRCPNCGEPLIPNIRRDKTFVEKPWTEKYQSITGFINAHEGKNLLLLELGVGINTPGIIRYPFEHLTLQRKNTRLIRINLKTDNLSLLANSDKAVIIQADIKTVLAKLSEVNQCS